MSALIRAALIRAARTFAQTAVGLIGTVVLLEDVPWVAVASGAGLAALVSLLMSLAGLPEVDAAEDARHLRADVEAVGNDRSLFPYNEET